MGKALLDAGRPTDAEKVYRADLAQHPKNAWSLMGLSQALAAQGKTADARAPEADAKKVWAGADVRLAASRF